MEALGGGLKFSVIFRIKRTMCEDLTLFDFLNVCSPTYLPYSKINLSNHNIKSWTKIEENQHPMIEKVFIYPFEVQEDFNNLHLFVCCKEHF
jgi:hypothetical protein